MACHYEYLRIGRRFFCLQQSLFQLIWQLFVRSMWFDIGSLRLDWPTKLAAVRALLLARWRHERAQVPVGLPAFGHVGMLVHGGYKLFDLVRGRVTKIFLADIPEGTVLAEIEAVRAAGALSFAPDLYASEPEQRRYQEAYVAGKRAYREIKSEAQIEPYLGAIDACLAEMIALRAPQSVGLGHYLDENMAVLGELQPICGSDASRDDIAPIRDYLMNVTGALREFGDVTVDLVFSHGDFSMQNVLLSRGGIAVVDWESVSSRSPLCDAYNFISAEVYYERAGIDWALGQIERMSRLLSDSAGINREQRLVWAPGRLSRNLFFFERVVVLVQRELSERRLAVILRSIDLFRRFEDLARRRAGAEATE